MISATVSERERPLGDGSIQEMKRVIQQLERERILLNVSRWIRLQNSLLRWSKEEQDWHDEVVVTRPDWAVDLIDTERFEQIRWGFRSRVVPPE